MGIHTFATAVGQPPTHKSGEVRGRHFQIGHAGDEPIAIQSPMFLRTLGVTGSGRSISLLALADQQLARGGAVLWVDAYTHPKVAAALRQLSMRYKVGYTHTGSFQRGDAAVIASLIALGGIGHCVPSTEPTLDLDESARTRTRVGGILKALTESQLRGAAPVLLIFNQVIAAFDGRTVGLGGLPAKLRHAGHDIVFSDTSVKVDAPDVAAHSRQFLLHRMQLAHARRTISSVLPESRSWRTGSARSVVRPSDLTEHEALARQISLLLDHFAIYCVDGSWTLLKSAVPSRTDHRTAA